MIEIECVRELDLPAEVVWEEVRHFDRVLNWVPRGEESAISVTGSGVGMIRDIELATMGYVQHRLEMLDHDARTFSYSLTGGKPLGMKEYVVVATVTPVDEDHCTLRWAGKMTADGSLDEEETGRALEMALGNMCTGIAAVLKNEAPQFVEQLRVDY